MRFVNPITAFFACFVLWGVLSASLPFLVVLGIAAVCGAALALIFWRD